MNDDQIEGERPIPQVGGFNGSFRGRKAITGLLLFILSFVAAYFVWERAQERKVVEVKEELAPIRKKGTMPRLVVAKEEPKPEVVETIAPIYIPPVDREVVKHVYLPPKVIPVNKSASGSSVGRGSGQAGQVAQSAPQAPQAGSGAFLGKPANVQSSGPQAGQAAIQTSFASQLQNRDTLITAGTYGGCVLSGEIITDVAGMAICMTTDDIKSSDGTNVLLPRSSKVIGRFNSETTQGIRRIDIQWTRIETPSGVVIDINSPATGPLGATGIAALVDNHLSERIVGALLLSFIDIAVGEATSGGNNTADVVIGGTASATGSLARDIFKETAGIKPTLFAHHGQSVGFILMRDLDFSKVSNVY